MKVNLLYGAGVLEVELPTWQTTVVEPAELNAASDPAEAVRRALRQPVEGPPLRGVVEPGATVAISVCDGTRPQPRHVVVPTILEELEGVVRLEDVTVLIATGTHRANTDLELRSMLGDAVVDAVRVVNHNARDERELVWMGRQGKNVPVWLNRQWVAADVRITAGFVEPHFFAGFSGGPKMVAPGLAGLETTLVLHDAARIGSPNARWGVTEGNPVHDDIRAIARSTGVHYAVDVVLQANQSIANAFGGRLDAMHRSACAVVKRAAMQRLDRRFDVVVTSNAGFPLDQNLYQCVKGMSAAAQIIKPGGVIICAGECRDGFPDHGSYRSELTSASSPGELLHRIERRKATVPDQWQIQIQASIQSNARVVMRTSSISADHLAEAHLEHTDDIAQLVSDTLSSAGTGAVICALPQGPLTVPYVEG